MIRKVAVAAALTVMVLVALTVTSLTAPLVALEEFPERSWTFAPAGPPGPLGPEDRPGTPATMDFFPAMTPVTFEDAADWADETAALRCEVTGKIMFPEGFMCWPRWPS